MNDYEKKSPTFSDLVKEVRADDYVQRAKKRVEHRKSPWNLLLIPLIFSSAGLIFYTLFQIMWQVHVIIYPAHIDKFGEFRGDGKSLSSFVSGILLLMPLLFASLPIGMMFANTVMWLIPPARRALDQEAKGVKRASFRTAMSGLWTVARVMVPVCLLLSFIGAATLANLR